MDRKDVNCRTRIEKGQIHVLQLIMPMSADTH